jgi:hypothetical protein
LDTGAWNIRNGARGRTARGTVGVSFVGANVFGGAEGSVRIRVERGENGAEGTLDRSCRAPFGELGVQ